MNAWQISMTRRPMLKCLLAAWCIISVALPIFAEPPADIARILKARKLVVSVYADNAAPFFMTDKDGHLYGLEVEMAFDMARTLGVDLCFDKSAQTYDEAVRKVENREADIAISILSKTTKRALSVSFSDPYVILHHAMLINRRKAEKLAGGKNLEEWLNASGIAIGAIKGSSYVEFAQRDYPSAQIVQFPDFNSAADAVLKGDIHATLYDDSAVQDWVSEHPEDAIYVQVKVRQNREDPIAIAVHPEDVHLLRWINLYLETIRKTGMLDKLVSTYLKSNEWKETATAGGSKQ